MEQRSLRLMIFLIAWQFFIFSVPAFSSTNPLSDIKIPSQAGNIKEVFEVDPAQFPNAPTIIQIQDAHCNYEAQKNLASILEYLIKEKNLKLIMVEGGNADVSLAFLRAYADKPTRERVADKYLRQGKISGEEYLDIVSDYDIELYGIEDRSLYEGNLDAFLSSEPYRQQALREAEALSSVVEALKTHIYPVEIIDLEKRKKEQSENKVTFTDYVSDLRKAAEQLRLDIKKYPDLYAFSESSILETSIDFKEAEVQRNDCIKELAGLLGEADFKELLGRTQDFKAQKMSDQEYYSFLKNHAEGRINLNRNYRQLSAYIEYLTLSRKINPASLLKDQAALEEKIAEAVCLSEDQKQLTRISRSLELLKRFLNLALTPEEYEVFKQTRDSLVTSSWVSFLQENCRKYNLAESPAASSVIDENIAKFEDFYKLGLAREQSFVKNIAEKLDSSGDKLAVLITGGFHTPGISRMLKERGFSYEVVTPVITKKNDSSIYFSVLRGEKTDPADSINEYDYTEEED